ncbi:hypothetical protein T01_1940 [Trichinella spiralis]|uniref:Uncharacterized protein n=1 Tax=Trichinella spiralis TaxID=6334 RepID=A0A0V1B4V1_TRISP|nr:hypothetical protein T01_1940 [Trichinella spiralis]
MSFFEFNFAFQIFSLAAFPFGDWLVVDWLYGY